MKERRLSKEEQRQREKEARSRRQSPDDAYRDIQRGVYSKIYQEQDAMPDDYRDAFRTPRDRKGRPIGSRKKRKKKVVLAVLLILLALIATALAIHQIYVRPPDVSEGENPESLSGDRREGVYTFLLVGRDDGGGGNTDTIMVGCFDTKNGTLDVLSIFRDTLVDVPWEIKKINSVYNRLGIEGLLEEVRDLIGYTPDYYFVVELSAVTQLVDAIGGVDYEVPYNMDYDDPTQDLYIHFKKGMQHLNGEDAVRLLRWRKNNSGERLSVGDIGRVEIQHGFLKAMAQQTVRLGNVTKIRQIADIVDKNLTSNLDYGQMIWFGEQALKMQKDGIQFHSLPGDYTGAIWSPTVGNYQSYVFVNDKELLNMINTYMNPYKKDITSDMQHVIYGTDVNNQPSLPTGGSGHYQEGDANDQTWDTPTGGQTPTEAPPTVPPTPPAPSTPEDPDEPPGGGDTEPPSEGGDTTPPESDGEPLGDSGEIQAGS